MSIKKPINQGLKVTFIFDNEIMVFQKLERQRSIFITESQIETYLIYAYIFLNSDIKRSSLTKKSQSLIFYLFNKKLTYLYLTLFKIFLICINNHIRFTLRFRIYVMYI